MNKKITCRLVDGKPVVEFKEDYIPKKGDIVVAGIDSLGWIAIVNELCDIGYTVQSSVVLTHSDFKFKLSEKTIPDYTCHATPEESEVMHYFLNENGYELVNGEVVKKRWVPKIGEKYYFLDDINNKIGVGHSTRGTTYGDSHYPVVFKTEQACQSACDKLNEYVLTLPQE